MKTAVVSTLIVLMAGIGAGAWWAYEEGRIGNNPRAPTLKNFKPVIDAWAERKGELRPKCVAMPSSSGKGARRGWAGLSSGETMGLAALTLTLRAPESERQVERDRSLLRMDAFAKAGFFSASETSMASETGGDLPARQYVLTQKGWENSNAGCIYFGRPEVLEIVSTARVNPDPEGIRAFEIVYKVGVRAAPEWTEVADVKEIFGDLKEHLAAKEYRLRLLRTERGWLPEPLTKNKGTLDRNLLNRTIDDLLPPLTTDRIQTLIKGHEGLDPPRACIALPQRTGVEADEIEVAPDGPMAVSYLERDLAGGAPPRLRETWLARMAALAKAGVFKAEAIPADSIRNRPAGTRYILDPAIRANIPKLRPGCLQLGAVKMTLLPGSIEVQPRQDGTLNYAFKAVGRIADDAWSRPRDFQDLPEARAFLDHGLPITGYVEFKDGDWKLIHGGAAAPVIIELPPRPLPAMSPGVSEPAKGASLPKSVHVFAVYRAANAPSTPGQKAGEGSIRVLVGKRGTPLTLVLSAYDPVHWRLEVEPGVEIEKVVVMGYTPGRISGVAADKVRYEQGYLPASSQSRRRIANDPSRIPETVERLVGRRPDSIESVYDGNVFNLGSSRSMTTSTGCAMERDLKENRKAYSGDCAASRSSASGNYGVSPTMARPAPTPLAIPQYSGTAIPLQPGRDVIIVPSGR